MVTDVSRLHIAIDELSLCVPVPGRPLKGCLSLDELIVFVDEDAEVSKGAASNQRKLQDACITAELGVQPEMLPDIVGSNSGRNPFA